MQPRVSVIVPVFKVEQYLHRCVESLRNQTLSDIEIILVDDGSPDRCPEMCDEYAHIDSRIKVVHKQNEGLGMACNSGMEVATGEFIAFVDSDDWIDPDMYETLVKTAVRYKADAVYSGLERNDGEKAIGFLPHPDSIEVFEKESNMLSLIKDMIASGPQVLLERRIQVSAKVVLYRKNIIDRNNIRFESERILISEDLLFNLDILTRAACAVVIPRYFYHYFVNLQSITNNTVRDKRNDFEKFHIHIQNRYSQIAGDRDFILRVDRLFIGYIRSYMDFIVNHTSLGFKDKIKRLKELCRSRNWDKIKSRYPVSLMPAKHKLILILTLNKTAGILFVLFKLFHR